jgi:hypothetical protein
MSMVVYRCSSSSGEARSRLLFRVDGGGLPNRIRVARLNIQMEIMRAGAAETRAVLRPEESCLSTAHAMANPHTRGRIDLVCG